jgi:hypothetical protein
MITTTEVTSMLKEQIKDLEGAVEMTETLLSRNCFRGDRVLRQQVQKFIRQKRRLQDRIVAYESFIGGTNE